MKTVIVGNGIVSLTCALRLAQRGSEVTIVGDPARTGSATLAAAAMLNSFAELGPGALATELDHAKLALSREATHRWHDLGAELGGLANLGHGTGTYVLDAGEGTFEMVVAQLAEAGEPHAIVEAAEVPGYAPVQRVSRAVRIDGEGWLDPSRVVAAIERVLGVIPGVTRIDGIAVRLRDAHGAIAGVELEGGTVLEGQSYLLANGASLSTLLDRSALGVRVQRVRYGIGSTLELRAPVPHAACLRGHGVYSVPRGDHVVIGSTNLVVDAPIADPTAVIRIRAAAVAQLDARLADAPLVREHVGWRPIGEDAFPLIGRTSIANLLIASGTRRDGFHLAPVIAAHLAEVLHDGPGDPRFAPFGPERAPAATR